MSHIMTRAAFLTVCFLLVGQHFREQQQSGARRWFVFFSHYNFFYCRHCKQASFSSSEISVEAPVRLS